MSRKYLPQKIKAELKTVMGNFNQKLLNSEV